MTTTTLEQLINDTFFTGQAELADRIRALVYQKAPRLFDCLDYEDDFAFLEPALFAWFTDREPRTPLDQQVLGLIDAAHHPATTPVRTDTQGRIHVPRLGLFQTGRANRAGELIEQDQGWFFRSGVHLERVNRIPETDLGYGEMRCGLYVPQVWQRFFLGQSPHLPASPRHPRLELMYLRNALHQLAAQDEELFQWIQLSTRCVQLYMSDRPNSFATLSAHGAAFINVSEDSDEISYLDNLCCQCGHIIFNAMTLTTNRYLNCHPSMRLQIVTGDEADERSVYAAFHGLFSSTLILRGLSRFLDDGALSPIQRHHALGRVAFYLGKLGQDLENMGRGLLFTMEGQVFFDLFQKAYDRCYQQFSADCEYLDLSNQPYVFSFQRFLEANPLEWRKTG